LATIRSMDPALPLKNAVSTVRTIKTFGVPVVHSTVNVANGQGPTLADLAVLLADDKPLDRTTVNSWEDIEFVQAVHATGRRKLVICALWTEVCMAFTALDALRDGYEVYPVVDAIAGTSPEAHRAATSRRRGSKRRMLPTRLPRASAISFAARSPVSHPPSMKPCASREQCSPAKWSPSTASPSAPENAVHWPVR